MVESYAVVFASELSRSSRLIIVDGTELFEEKWVVQTIRWFEAIDSNLKINDAKPLLD